MAKKRSDRNGKKKSSTKKQASLKRPTRKQQHTNGSAYRVPMRLAYVPDDMFSWGDVRLPTTEGNHVPPDMSSMMAVWNPTDPQLATNATGRPSLGQGAADISAAGSSDVHAREDYDTPEINSANPTPHAPETRAEETTPNSTSGSRPDIHETLPTLLHQGFRFLPPVSLPAVHSHLPHAALDASPLPRFYPYRSPRPRFSSPQATQLGETHVSMNSRTNSYHSGDIPQALTVSNAEVQVHSTSTPLPRPFVDAATGAWFWRGSQAALHDDGVQTQALGLDIGFTPTQSLYGHAEPILQEPFVYPSVVPPEETSFLAQNAVAGPSSQSQNPLMADHGHLYHAGNAQPQWGIPQHQLNPGWPSQPVAGPSRYEESMAELGPLDVEGLSEFSAFECWPSHPQGGNPPPPPGSQW